MSHVEDRWFVTTGGARRRTGRHGTGRWWRARYLNPDGAERSRSFERKLDAERFLAEIEHSKLAGTYRDPDAGRVSLRKYAAGWVQGYPEDSSRGEQIRRQLRLHIEPGLGGVTLGELERRPSMVQQFINRLPMSAAGASQVVITLTAILNAAADDGLITRNPLKAKSVKAPRQPKRKITPWTAEQIEALRAGLPARWRPMVDCGAGLGLRQGEIFGLAVDAVGFLQRRVHVARQVKRVNNRLWFSLPKGGRERDVPLPQAVSRALAAHIEAHPPVEVTLPWNEPGSRRHGQPVTAVLLFTRQGGALQYSTFNTTAWRPARLAAGPPEGGMHQLRHYYASVLLAGGVDIKALSEYLGHHDPAITLRIYAHLMPSAEGRALRAVEAAFSAESGVVSTDTGTVSSET
ncbi:MAG TPA: site-specific integrase [Streptosporangiaceae bacterium]